MGRIRYPKNHNRVMLAKPDDGTNDGWMTVSVGISGRTNNFTENTETYYYFSGHGAGETVPTSQDVSVSFSGHRAMGDDFQDYIFEDVLYDLEKRDIEIIDFDDGIDVSAANPPPNGWRIKGSLTISDPGSGDANSRQNIGFTINYKGKPQRGTVVHDAAADTYTWTPATP